LSVGTAPDFGARFRQRVEGIIEKFEELKSDLDKERKFMNKREGQIQRVIETTVGMYGDLQGIAGKALPEIPSLDLPLLEAPDSALG
jgi:hypothetical protein